MVHIQPVKSVWSTLHKVLLQTVGNKQRQTVQSVMCLKLEEVEEEEENGAAKRTREAFFAELPEAISQLARHTRLLFPTIPLLLCYSNSVPVLQVSRYQR